MTDPQWMRGHVFALGDLIQDSTNDLRNLRLRLVGWEMAELTDHAQYGVLVAEYDRLCRERLALAQEQVTTIDAIQTPTT